MYYTDIVLGTGWAGNIRNAGFKGEATWFQPKSNLFDSAGVISATLSVDYSFKKPVYIQGAVLYNSHRNRNNSFFSFSQISGSTLSAKNLMPSDWSLFGQVTDAITPILNAGISVIYGFDPGFIFTMPSLTYSISNNWDITLLHQGVYFTEKKSNPPFNSIYIRLKWNF